ncbi:hypothetical protein MMC21_003911 [Puttea exsequens]|nr:hypothetical protein [Puttea exsequens]
MDPASRVKVEYHDPAGIYEKLAQELQRRLPLRDLNWSPGSARPTRSISKLHIELVPEENSRSRPGSTSNDAQENGAAPRGEGPRKERRHQIPGLRRTPYLKIYLLQCSDIESYKSSYRKHLREWVTANSRDSRSKQENHDAFEWLIVHVPSTSTDGSRPSSRAKGEGGTDKRSGSSRWTSRSSNTLIEKIQKDFNGSSKNAVDRVAQVTAAEQPVDGSKQANRLSQSQDGPDGWTDLISKLKLLILASFDLRVGQYEEDIKEKEMQRNLPGWNFNTFFILKEGLARGFESVGLIEDAITGYHELAFGLKQVIDEERNAESPGPQTTHFEESTEELYEAYKTALSTSNSPTTADEDRDTGLGKSVLDTERKPFQDLILTNKISVFDFQCYVFARQSSLSLRLANTVTAQSTTVIAYSEPAKNAAALEADINTSLMNRSEPEDLLMLAEVTTRSADFITSTARTIREDIASAVGHFAGKTSGDILPALNKEIIDNIVSDWEFSASHRMLRATSTQSLSAQLEPLLRQLRSRAEPGDDGVAQNMPADPSVHRISLPPRTSSLPDQGTIRSPRQEQETWPSITSLDAVRLLPPGSSRPGAQELAAQRGELLVLARRVLGNLGQRHGKWPGGIADAASTSLLQEDEMDDVDLGDSSVEEKSSEEPSPSSPKVPSLAGICNRSLVLALTSSDSFYAAYEELTISALACYIVGDRKKAAEAMTADLAIIRFRLEDYRTAAAYFRQLAPFYAKDHWTNLEFVMLNMYAQCLRHLGKTEECVRISLKAFAKTIQVSSAGSQDFQFHRQSRINAHSPPPGSKLRLTEILASSESLGQIVIVPLDQYFDRIKLDKYIRHSPEHDGFELTLQMRSLLPESFQAESVWAKIVSTEEDRKSEIWLYLEGNMVVGPGSITISLKSKMMLPGWYILNAITIRAAKVLFSYDLSPQHDAPLLTRTRDSMTARQVNLLSQKRLLVWPKTTSAEIHLSQCESITLEQLRSIQVKMLTGRNDISRCILHLKPATAGLRLFTARAVVQSGDFEITEKTQPGRISFFEVPADSIGFVKIPYDLENDLTDIVVHAEFKYSTTLGEFTYSCYSRIDIRLSLAINVQDNFKKDILFSRFTIGTAFSTPIRVASCELEGNESYEVTSPAVSDSEVDVYPAQPLSVISMIRHRLKDSDAAGTAQRKLYLQIHYRCMEDDVHAAIKETFSSDISSTPFSSFARPLTSNLVAVLRKSLLGQDLEKTALLRQITLESYESYCWRPVVAGLPNGQVEPLTKWLRDWHHNRETISLDGVIAPLPTKHLTVPVEIPEMQFVHTASLRPLTELRQLSPGINATPIGHGLPMELVISHTRRWHLGKGGDTDKEPHRFSYEVQGHPDHWIVGGQKKAHFSVREDEVLRFSILLWPQITGHLMYPSVYIQPLPADSDISNVTDDRSQGESVLVVSDTISTTVSLDLDGSGSARLVEEKKRTP